MKATPFRRLGGSAAMWAGALAIAAPPASAQPQVEDNVVYGVFGGLSLTLDVYHPAQASGRGILLVPGSAWGPGIRGADGGYSDPELKDGYPYLNALRDSLVTRGFTIFVLNHRLAPRFTYPAAANDVRRAVRFVRANATQFGIDPERLAALGHSSGGHLASLVAVEPVPGDARIADPVESQSSQVAAVVSIAGVYDLTVGLDPEAMSFIGAGPPRDDRGNPMLGGRYADASPVTHVTRDDPPFLIVHGDADSVALPEQSIAMADALRAANVEVEMVSVVGGTHLPPLDANHIAQWLDAHLQ